MPDSRSWLVYIAIVAVVPSIGEELPKGAEVNPFDSSAAHSAPAQLPDEANRNPFDPSQANSAGRRAPLPKGAEVNPFDSPHRDRRQLSKCCVSRPLTRSVSIPLS